MSDIRLVKNDTNPKSDNIKLGISTIGVQKTEAQVEDCFNTLQKYHDKLNKQEYFSADDLKAYKSAMDGYIKYNNRLRNLNKTFGNNFTEEEENQWNDGVASLKKGYTEISNYFSGFKTKKEYNDAMAAVKQREKMKTDDLNVLAKEIKDMEAQYLDIEKQAKKDTFHTRTNVKNKIKLNPVDMATDLFEYILPTVHNTSNPMVDRSKFNPLTDNEIGLNEWRTPLNKEQQEKLAAIRNNKQLIDFNKEQLAPSNVEKQIIEKKQMDEVVYNNSSNYFAGLTLDEARKKIGQKKVYLKIATRVQNKIRMESVNDITSENYDVDFEYIAKKGEQYGLKEKGQFGGAKHDNWVAYYRNNPIEMKLYERVFLSTRSNFAQSVNENTGLYDELWLAKYGNEDEYKRYNYYFEKDKQNGTNEAKTYLSLIAEDIRERRATEIGEYYNDKGWLSKYGYGWKVGTDQIVSGTMNAFNFSDDYIPVTSTQMASQKIREDLYDTGKKLPDWLGGSSLGQVGYDLTSTTSSMLPSIVAGAVAEVAVPGSGAYVTAGLMGLSASGNAYQQMLNQGYDKISSRTYATLVFLSEATLSSLLSGMTGGKFTEKAIETAIKGIDNGFLRFAVRWGMSGLSEIPEEFLQTVLEPVFQNIAVGYKLNDMSEFDWSQAVYDGLLGGISGLGLGGIKSAINTGVEQYKWNNAGKNVRANNTIINVFDIVRLIPHDSDAYTTYTRYIEKGIDAKNITDTQIGRLYDEANTYAKGVLNNKKSSVGAKENATKILRELSKVDEKSTVDKNTIARIERGVAYESALHENVDALIESGLESAENTKSHKLAVELKNKIKSGKEITTQEIIKLQNANTSAINNEVQADLKNRAQDYGKNQAKLFVEIYDQNINGDIEDYQNSFNLVLQLVKNDFSIEHILKHKGVLTEKQVGIIYTANQGNRIEISNLKEQLKYLQADVYDKNILLTNSTNAVTNPLSSYPSAKRSMIIDFLESVDEGLKSLVERVRSGSNKFERFIISNVTEREATDIKNLLGIDIEGYTHNINTNAIKHILKRHGENGKHDSTMSNDNDIARIGWVIENYDSVERLTGDNGNTLSLEFRDKFDKPAYQIRYSKKINGTYYVVEAVCENKYNKLWVQTAYLHKKEAVTQVPDAAGWLPMVTPKTPPASPTSTSNIPYDNVNVNLNDYELKKRAQDYGENHTNLFTELTEPDAKDIVHASNKDSLYEYENNIISSFDIKRMNDTIHVQEKVFDTLLKEGFFEDLNERKTVVKNKSSGMIIEINKSGIRETFNYHNFTQMPHEIMVDKLLLIRNLPFIIENGKLYEDNVKNMHNKQTSVSYAYIVQNVNINGIEKVATVVIRKSPQKNKFWTLQIDIKNNIGSTPAGISRNSITGLLTSNVDSNISQDNVNVKLDGNQFAEDFYKENNLQANGNNDIIYNNKYSDEELNAAILRYKSGQSYQINAKLRESEVLDKSEQYFVNVLNEALQQLPIYEGTAYRNVVFDDFFGEEDYVRFLKRHIPDEYISYNQFLSFSKERHGYPVDGKYQVKLVIKSKNSRDVDGFGNNMESEVIYPLNSVFIVDKILYKKNIPTIYLQEAIVNGRYSTDETDRNTVQHMQTQHTAYANMQGVSEWDTVRDTHRRIGSQFTASERQQDTVRGEGRQDTVLSTAREEQKIVNEYKKATSQDEVAFSMPIEHDYRNDNETRFSFNDKNIDKYGYNQDNNSRANKQGDLVNEFYNALTKREWAIFYNKLVKEGYVADTRIGAEAYIEVGDKLVIAKRKYTGKNKHDYIVTDVYKLNVDDNDYYTLSLLKDAFNKGEIDNDKRRIYSFVDRVGRNFGRKELLEAFDRYNGTFATAYDEHKQGKSNIEIYGVSEERSTRYRLSLGDKSSGQEIKSSLSNEATSDKEVAFSMPINYSYQQLINKPNMKITQIEYFGLEKGLVSRKEIVDKAIENAKLVGRENKDGNAVVYVKDIDTEIVLSKSGLRHGLDRRLELLAPVILKTGEILENAIRINELSVRNENIDKSYVLIGAAKNIKNEPYIVTFVVNKFTNEISSVDVLYAINAKKEPAGLVDPSVPANIADYFTGSNISISKLLDYVNKYFPDILPESVLRHYGYERRPEGKLGESALFSMPIGNRKRSVKNNIIELSKDNELSKKIGDLRGAAKYKVIQQYILDVLSGEEIMLSDGKIAVVDKSDALHIANKSANKKTAQISGIKEIVEKAILVADEESIKGRKFEHFYYYEATVKYDGEIFNVYLDVGRARNDGTYHIYDITNKIRDTANRINGLERPKPNEGYALTNGISNNSISKNADYVNNDYTTNTDIFEGIQELNSREIGYIEQICKILGRDVVFEDLRNMVYKGEIISPDGYVENGVIHLNIYAENPIGFVFKHELTHFAENSTGYKKFANNVKKSDLYKKWLFEKTGESNLNIAEYKYKQGVVKTHNDIYSVNDPKTESEMIADFVGGMLFNDNGNSMLKLINSINVKERNFVVKFVLDFVNWIKKKLGQIGFVRLQLEMFEYDFSLLLLETVELQSSNAQDFNTLDDIQFCFLNCYDESKIKIAQQLEAEGYSTKDIFEQIGLIKNAYGNWKYEIETIGFKFYSKGNARNEKIYINNKILKPNGDLEGKLNDFVKFPALFEIYPKFKNIKVLVKSNTLGTVKFYIDKQDGNKPVIAINKKLCDDYNKKASVDVKPLLLRELQKAIHYYTGERIGMSIEKWQEMETEGKTPYSEKLGRNLTAQEAYKYTADNYEAEMVADKRWMRDLALSYGTPLEKLNDVYLYSQIFDNYDRNNAIIFDENDNPVIVGQYENPKTEINDEEFIDGLNEKNKETDSYTASLNDEADFYLYNQSNKPDDNSLLNQALKINENSNTLKSILKVAKMINKNDMTLTQNLIAGSDSLISNVAENAPSFAKRFNKNEIERLSKMSLSAYDTVGRLLSRKLHEFLNDTFFKNERGEIISLFTLKMQGIGGFKHSELGLVAGTLASVEQQYSEYNEGSVANRDVHIQEVFVKMKNPLVLNYTPFELSIAGVHDLVDRGIISHKTFVKLTTSSSAKITNYYGIVAQRLREYIKNAGYDGIIYYNDSTDVGSASVVVFDESQMVTVAENGKLLEDSGVTESNFDIDVAQQQLSAVINTNNIRLFSADNMYNNHTNRKRSNIKIRAGNAGFMEQKISNAIDLQKNLEDVSNVQLSGKDMAGRDIGDNIYSLIDTIFKSKQGNVLSFYYHCTLKLEKKLGVTFGAFNSTVKEMLDKREKNRNMKYGKLYEVYINSKKPLVINFDNWNNQKLALFLLENNMINQEKYNILMSKKSASKEGCDNLVANNILDIIKFKQYDSIVFLNNNGEFKVMPFDESQIIIVAENGMLIDGNGITQLDVIDNVSNENYKITNMVIKSHKRDEVDVNGLKSALLKENDSSKKMHIITEFYMCRGQHKADTLEQRKAGSSGFLEKGKLNVWQARATVMKYINNNHSEIPIADLDTVNRIISVYKKNILKGNKAIDTEGRPLAVFSHNEYGENKINRTTMGYYVSTLTAAHDMALEYKRKHKNSKVNVIQEYNVIIKKAYHIMFDPANLTPTALAKYMLADGIITNKQYQTVIARSSTYDGKNYTYSSRYLTQILLDKGFDCISYMNERFDPGSIGLIVFDKRQLIPIAVDGLDVENSDRTLADSDNEPAFLLDENTQDYERATIEDDNVNFILDETENNVEKSQLENIENYDESGIIEETVDNDTGVPGEYNYKIIWQNRNIPARKDGKGHRAPRTKQHNERVDKYELKINPDNESYHLDRPNGKTIQFENMRNGIVQDGKLVMNKNSIYYVKEKIPVLNLNILKQARRQLEAANLVGYKVEWLVSDKKAVEQIRQLFNENNLDIIVTYYPE